MIQVKIKKTETTILSVECTGHADYSEHGSDIVCAAVSALMITTLNGILEVLKLDIPYVYDEKGKIKITNFQKNRDANILICSLVLGLVSIEREYSDFIELHYEEV